LLSGPDILNLVAVIALIAAAIPALLFSVNVWFFRRPGRPWNKRLLPPLSVLIPARDEQDSIGAAISSVLASRGVELEVIVLDDGSTDRTAAVVLAMAKEDLRVRLATAPALPRGWIGKQHACWVLACEAKHDVFCFLDADVRVEPEAIYRMVSELNVVEQNRPERALVSGFPRQETGTFLERLLIPLIHFVLLGFLPLPAERWSGLTNFATGCGQFLMVRREPYLASGGHSAIRASMHDGLQLPRLFRRRGFRTSVYDLSRDASCRMYRNAGEVWRGLSKNATEGMASIGRIPVFTLLLFTGQVLPIFLVVSAWIRQDESVFGLSLLALASGYGIRFICAWRYRQSWGGAMLHPLGVLIILILQWYALLGKLARRPIRWKERAYRDGARLVE
jgi:glycosyltransferase involved in cell wall biosynthesis